MSRYAQRLVDATSSLQSKPVRLAASKPAAASVIGDRTGVRDRRRKKACECVECGGKCIDINLYYRHRNAAIARQDAAVAEAAAATAAYEAIRAAQAAGLPSPKRLKLDNSIYSPRDGDESDEEPGGGGGDFFDGGDYNFDGGDQEEHKMEDSEGSVPPDDAEMKDADVIGAELSEMKDESGESSDDQFDESEQKKADLIEEVVKNPVGRPALPTPELDQPVAEGCPSKLRHLLTDLFTLAASNNISQRATTDLFELLKSHLPQVNNILPNYRQAGMMLEKASPVKAKHYPVCDNDCWMADLDVSHPKVDQVKLSELRAKKCPKCSKPLADAKGVFHKKYLHIGLEDRLRMMCEDPRLSSSMVLPWPGVGPEPTAAEKAASDVILTADELAAGKVRPPKRLPRKPTEADECLNLHQSLGWWEGVHELGEGWGPGQRNIVLSLNVDGFQPFKRGGISITPLVLMVLNLPENLRHHADNMILAGVIPKKQPKNHNTYLNNLVQELNRLHRDGFHVVDPITKLPQVIKVKLLFTSCDYPAHCHLNAQHQGGKHGCHKCDIVGTSISNRMVYGAYAQLGAGRPLPSNLTPAVYNERVATWLKQETLIARGDKSKAKHLADQKELCFNVDGESVLSQVSGFNIVDNTLIDMMHTGQGVVFGHLIRLMKNGVEVNKAGEYLKAGERPVDFPTFGINDAMIKKLDKDYCSIEAPIGVTPHSKCPFQRSGQMTAHHWLNFSKVYGKYLCCEAYHTGEADEDKNEPLSTLCSIFTVLELCYRSHATAQMKIDLDIAIKKAAKKIEANIPKSDWAIVLHNLMFHIPATIKRWGPTRGYWCFPFERFLGKLSDSIKSRKHPEVNLVNRYVRSVATRHNGFNSEAFEGENPLHPLVPVGAVQSIMNEQEVIWPERTKHNSRRSIHNGKDEKHARKRLMVPLLGQAICDLFFGRLSSYEMVNFKQSVQVGRWTYGLKVVEDGRKTGATRASWFRIRAKYVPHYKEWLQEEFTEHEANQFVYGRINRFVLLYVWGQTFQLAEVMLFQRCFTEPITGYTVIDTSNLLNKQLPIVNKLDYSYIQAKYLHSPIAVAPIHNFAPGHILIGGRLAPKKGVSNVIPLASPIRSPYFVLPLEV